MRENPAARKWVGRNILIAPHWVGRNVLIAPYWVGRNVLIAPDGTHARVEEFGATGHLGLSSFLTRKS